MGVNRLFWPQQMMDDWVVEEKAVVENDVLTVTDDHRKYQIHQALHFMADVADGTDPHGLVGKVKEIETVLAMGAEHYMDSVIIGDTAYQVVQGFTGIPVHDPNRASRKISDISQAVKTQAGEAEQDDREMLANFLLDNL